MFPEGLEVDHSLKMGEYGNKTSFDIGKRNYLQILG